MKSSESQQEWTIKSKQTVRLTRTMLNNSDLEDINQVLKELGHPAQLKQLSKD
jgi:hypothetical protein